MKPQLLIDGCAGAGFECRLLESSGGGLTRFRGKFQEADGLNKNNRQYPYAVLNGQVDELQEAIREGRLVGELDHPDSSVLHYANASHRVTKLWWEGKNLMGEGEILSTPAGKILQALISDGVKIGISSRGVGTGALNNEGVTVIGEGFKLITFDAVADPSTFSAFQERVANESGTVPGPVVTDYSAQLPQEPARSAGQNKTTPVEEGVRVLDIVGREALLTVLGAAAVSRAGLS